jgi:hypothetical protein
VRLRGPPLPQPVRSGRFREGIGWRKSDLDAFVIAGGLQWTLLSEAPSKERIREEKFIMSDVEQAYEAATEQISKANEAYNKAIAGFRGTIKNDLASIAASGEKVTVEAGKIQRQCQAAVATMTSPEMLAAIQNAERLAQALKSISELQSHKITFAVLDSKPA